MVKVAIVKTSNDIHESLNQALKLIGGIDSLNRADREVTIKVGVFDPKSMVHSSVQLVEAVAKSFNKAPRIYIAESDNYCGKALDRLQIWKELFSQKLVPFSLSDDKEARAVKVADEKLALSHVLFKPNVLVSTHILRTFECGSVLKNLLGLVPDKRKMRFHKKLAPALIDMFEAVGGIDLAVLDGTKLCGAVEAPAQMLETNTLVVGKDAIAVESVGAVLVGLKPDKMTTIKEATRRGLGESDLSRIEIVGGSVEEFREEFGERIQALAKRDPKKMPKMLVNLIKACQSD